MKLCSFQVDLRIGDNLTEEQQERLLDAVDALNLPQRLRGCVRASLDRVIEPNQVKVTVQQ